MGDRYGKGSRGHALIHIETRTLPQRVQSTAKERYSENVDAEKYHKTGILTTLTTNE